MMKILQELVRNLSRLPGIGAKSASRIAYYLIQSDPHYNQNLSALIAELQSRIFTCSECGSFTETDPCPICSDTGRDNGTVCVVEQPQDVLTIEASGAYHGLFHVLQGAISPLDGIGPDQLTIKHLMKRITDRNFSEVILATNPTEAGDTTALYISHLLKERSITVTRLASGLPIGGDLEYADRITLARSLRGRIRLE